MSLQYIASGSSLKEYILVEARQDLYRYAFYMNLENLVPQMQEDNIAVDYTYSDGALTRISRGGYLYPPTVSNRTKMMQDYYFTYNEFGNMTGSAVGNRTLGEYEYDPSGQKLQLMRYGGEGTSLATINYGYDELDRMTSATYNDINSNKTKTYGYQYSSDGSLAGITENGEQVYVYDTSNRITSQKCQIGDDAHSETYSYNGTDGTLQSMMAAGGESIYYRYDNLKSLDHTMMMRGSSQILKTAYTYKARTGDAEANTTSQISRMQFIKPSNSSAIVPALNYTYDTMGNITSVTPDGGTAVTYTYDEQNQLSQERKGNIYTAYTYDTYGNIRSAKDYQDGFGMISGYTFEYGDSQWRDLLTKVSYTAPGSTTPVTKTLTYDAIGNPTVYSNGQNTWNMTWQYGRQLAAAQKGSTVVTYEYDVDGIREKKTVGSKVYDYVTLDGQVIRETITTDSSAPVVVDYMYDNSGEPYKIVVTSGSISYVGYYVLNQQGDVIAIIDAGSITEVKTAEYGIKRIDFKLCSPVSNGIHLEYPRWYEEGHLALDNIYEGFK